MKSASGSLILFSVVLVFHLMSATCLSASYDPEKKYLIPADMITELDRQLEPGDIFWERQDYKPFTILVGSFWVHNFIHTGTFDEAAAYFDTDEVRDWFEAMGSKGFADHVRSRMPEEYLRWITPDEKNRDKDVVESLMRTGVTMSSLYEAANSDYLAVVRPKVSRLDKALAIIKALKQLGKSYDASFGMSDEKIYCTELVVKAFGFDVPLRNLLFGVQGWNPTNFLRFFMPDERVARSRGTFITFIRARRSKADAVISTEEVLAETMYWNGMLAPGIQHQL